MKVGTLDDPIWEQSSDGFPRRNAEGPDPDGGEPIVLGVVLALIAVGLTLRLSRSSQRGGDPGGRILKALQPVSAAVPAGSAHVAVQSYDAIWSAGCPDNPDGQAGWSEVRVSTTFTNVQPQEQVVEAVNSALVGEGWTRHDESFGRGQGVVAHWTKRLGTGTSAEAAVYPVPAGTTNWLLTATSKPLGDSRLSWLLGLPLAPERWRPDPANGVTPLNGPLGLQVDRLSSRTIPTLWPDIESPSSTGPRN